MIVAYTAAVWWRVQRRTGVQVQQSVQNSPVLMFDAAGLSLFAVSGAQKALEFGLNPMMAALLGMVTGIGGGKTRDVLLAEIPQVLRSDLYAVVALAGAAVGSLATCCMCTMASRR